MIKWIVDKLREKAHSLYVGLFLVILVGVMLGIVTYTVARLSANSLINNYYLSEEKKEKREIAHIESLQKYITDNRLSSNDMKKISKWAQGNKYVYLMLYKDDQLFFTSDMIIPDDPDENGKDGESDSETENGDGGTDDNSGEDNSGEGGSEDIGDGESGEDGSESGDGEAEGDGTGDASQEGSDGIQGGSGQGGNGSQGGSGITVEYPTREELKEYAQNNDQYVIELLDGMLLASVAEFSEYLYYDLANITSLVFAMIVLAFIVVNYFRRIVARIKRLETDVTIVTHGNMTHKIHSKGYDEISILSSNVDNMRNSILENLEKEREARDANTELITAMSHDIRTPLTVLLGYIEMMKSEADGDSVMGEYLNATERTAMRLKQLSDDMFKYSLAFGDAAERVTLEEYDAAMLMEQMLSEHILLLREMGYDVVTDGAEELPRGATVCTDAQNLMRIVDNIFSNLRKYADESFPILIRLYSDADLRIVVEFTNTPKRSVSKVESNGIGMKTCQRLANFIADSFEYGEKNEKYFTRICLKAVIPPTNEEEA